MTRRLSPRWRTTAEVFVLDVNVLVYASNEAAPQHQVANEWLDSKLSEREPVGFPWVTTIGYLRIVTHPNLLPAPSSVDDALDQINDWLGATPAMVPAPTASHHDTLARLLRAAGRAGNLTTDAHLAAIAIDHRATMVTFDGDFAQFKGLRWTRPGP